MMEGSGAGSVPLTKGSESGRQKTYRYGMDPRTGTLPQGIKLFTLVNPQHIHFHLKILFLVVALPLSTDVNLEKLLFRELREALSRTSTGRHLKVRYRIPVPTTSTLK
jgi:hypothetical protein